MLENDFVNANTGLLDPRHLFGATNQDVSDIQFTPPVSLGSLHKLSGVYTSQSC